ncbi:UNVERIFIED_CONTAM: RNA-binding protein 2 [Sesamum radiatum]|uniref:RNA-binding protein 2 n=1 Tax=Sesamum radiatum TaxID=300843 RepID=A0AAW2THX8_SESRA
MPNNHYNPHGDYQGRPFHDMVSQIPTDAVRSGYYAHHDGRGHTVHMQHDSGYFSRENYWDTNHARAPYDHYLPSGSSFAPARTGGGRTHIPLPPDACSTLYVEVVFPSPRFPDIFRPFMGYMGLRLVRREPRQPGRQPVILCFVDFLTSTHAATAMELLQGYQVDINDSDSGYLRLEFSRCPDGRRPGFGEFMNH